MGIRVRMRNAVREAAVAVGSALLRPRTSLGWLDFFPPDQALSPIR